MSNKTLGKTAYYTKTGTNYILEEPVKAQQDILVYTRKSVETNYSTFVPYNDYTISYSENGSTLIFTNPVSLTDVESIKVIYPFTEVTISSEVDFSDNNVKKDLLSLKDRIIELEDLLEKRVLMQENSVGDTQNPQLKEKTFFTLIDNKPSIKTWDNFVTFEDAGMVNSRTKVYDLTFNLLSDQVLINTNLEEVPESNLCFIDRMLVTTASSISLVDGDYFIYKDVDNKVKIAVRRVYKDTTFKLFYNIITDTSSGEEGNIDLTGIEERMEKFEDVVQLMNSSSDILTVGRVLFMKGYYGAGDGAEHYRIISNTPNELSITLTNGKYANLLDYINLNVLHCGAKGDGIFDNTTIFSNILKHSKNLILPPEKIFLIKDKLNLTKHTTIKCNTKEKSTIKFNTTLLNDFCINSVGFNLYLENINFESISTNDNCLYIYNSDEITIKNCYFDKFNSHCKISTMNKVFIEENDFGECNSKFFEIGDCENVKIDKSNFDQILTSNETNKNYIYNCKLLEINNCTIGINKELNVFYIFNCDKITINSNYFKGVNVAVKTENNRNLTFSNNFVKYINDGLNNDVPVITAIGKQSINVSNNMIASYKNYIININVIENCLTFINNISDYSQEIKTVNINSEKCVKINNVNIEQNKVFYGLFSENLLVNTIGINFKQGDLWYTNGFLKDTKTTLLYQRITDGSYNIVDVDWRVVYSN